MSAKTWKAIRANDAQIDRLDKRLDETDRRFLDLEVRVAMGLSQRDRELTRTIRERNEARRENRRAADAVRTWKGIAYACLIAAIVVLVISISTVKARSVDSAVEDVETVTEEAAYVPTL